MKARIPPTIPPINAPLIGESESDSESDEAWVSESLSEADVSVVVAPDEAEVVVTIEFVIVAALASDWFFTLSVVDVLSLASEVLSSSSLQMPEVHGSWVQQPINPALQT